MYPDYNYQIWQLLNTYLPRITAALESLADFIPDVQSYFSSALGFASSNKIYLLGLFFLGALGYIFGKRNLI